MHRAAQIIDAVAAAIAATAPSGHKVFTHRRESLSEEQDELPAHSVDFGPDRPPEDAGASNLAFIDSVLSVSTTHVAVAQEEHLLRALLLEMRADAHVALMTDRTLSLAFVTDTRYQGADEPEIDVSGETLVGTLTSDWAIDYRMNITDPN